MSVTKEDLLKQQKEIASQLKELEMIEYKANLDKNKEELDKLRVNKEIILSLLEHSRTSCSDTNVSNGYSSASYGARCSKCHLIEILNSDYENEFVVTFGISIDKIKI
jgi:hypothetical protein